MRKLFVLILNILISFLLLVTGVFAWISYEQVVSEGRVGGRDIFMSSSYLFSAFTDAKITNQSGTVAKDFNYLSSEWQKNGDLTIKLPTTGSGSLNSYIYNQGGKYYLNLEIKVHIKAYTNINL
ncbi:MAG: hypothetical protein GX149_01850, partial [Acholeplasmataceae bacterium]|nr:hypothetical protein [Acholeplasmataceae bacterium]